MIRDAARVHEVRLAGGADLSLKASGGLTVQKIKESVARHPVWFAIYLVVSFGFPFVGLLVPPGGWSVVFGEGCAVVAYFTGYLAVMKVREITTL